MKIDAYAPPVASFPVDLKLDANEGRRAPAEFLERAARDSLASSNLYPSTAALEARLALRMGVAPERVMVGAGGDDVLARICRAFLGPGRTAVMTSPTFEMIPRDARASGAVPIEVPWWEGPFPVERVVRSVTRSTGVVFVVSPNNPTGNTATADDLHAIAAAAPDAVLCVDQAYTEYADADLSPTAFRLPNAVVVRTLSKAWGLAGLRVGYGVGSPALTATLRAAGGPYPVSSLSLDVAERWLDTGETFVRDSVRLARAERATLATLLRSIGLHVIDSQANFVLARLPSPARAWDASDSLARAFRIGVRRFPHDSILGAYLRITCPCEDASFSRLTTALRAVLGATT